MIDTITNPRYRMFPLDQILSADMSEIKQQITKREPILLLSQIQSIDRNIVEQLERAGIYDTDDFRSADSSLSEYLNLKEHQFDALVTIINQTIANKSTLPRFILDLPSNYAIIAADSTKEKKTIALLWRGMEVTIQRDRSDYWVSIKQQLDKLLVNMNNPELIGRINLQNTPHWLEKVSPLSTYLSNIALETSLVDTALECGLDQEILTDRGQVVKELLSTAYLIKLGQLVGEEFRQ